MPVVMYGNNAGMPAAPRKYAAVQLDFYPLVWLAVAVGCILGGAVLPKLGLLLSSVFTLVIVWKARVDLMPALLLLQLGASCFGPGAGLSTGLDIDRFRDETIMIFGFPTTTYYYLLLGVTARVLYECANHYATFRHWGRGGLALLLIALPVAVYNAVMGRDEGNASWTTPVRVVLTMFSLLYGIILARSWPEQWNRFVRSFILVATLLLGLAGLSLFHQRILWFYCAVVPPVALVMLRSRIMAERILAILAFVLVTLYAFGIRPDARDYVDFTGSLTLLGLWGVATLLGILNLIGSRGVRNVLGLLSGWPALLMCVLFTVWNATSFSQYADRRIAYDERLSFIERAQFKTSTDRGVLWQMALHDVRTPPYIFRPGGRLIVNQDGYVIGLAAHNTFLDQLATNGWWVGGISLLVMMGAVARNAKVMGRSRSALVRALAVGCVVTGTVGVTTGHGPLAESNYGFWFMSFAGLCSEILYCSVIPEEWLRRARS